MMKAAGLIAMHRKAENAELFFLFRECGESEDYLIHLPSSNGYLLDLTSGKLQHFKTENGIFKLSLSIGETAVILLTKEALDTERKREFKNKLNIKNKFTFRKELELICDENGFENISHTERSVPVTLGDWAKLLGSAYSGSGVYETSFTLPAEKIGKEGEIDLGVVHFSAEVCLNGQSLGTALMPPYKLKIPVDLLKESNELKITVTNTSANWYIHTDYFDKQKINELSPYFETELKFAKDLVSGGLYGPVSIHTE